jgi:hypothetical protein
VAASKDSKAQRVRLGRRARGGVAPAFVPLVERGIESHPLVAAGLRGRAVFRFTEDIESLRISFKARSVVVEDGDLRKPDLVIAGRIADVVNLATAPHWRGLPKPIARRGRDALRTVVRGHVRVEGNRKLARGLLQLLSVEG